MLSNSYLKIINCKIRFIPDRTQRTENKSCIFMYNLQVQHLVTMWCTDTYTYLEATWSSTNKIRTCDNINTQKVIMIQMCPRSSSSFTANQWYNFIKHGPFFQHDIKRIIETSYWDITLSLTVTTIDFCQSHMTIWAYLA